MSDNHSHDESPADNEDRWTVATAQDGDMPIIFRIRNVPDDFPRASYPQLIAVAWPYESVDSGMPAEGERLQMERLEDLLSTALEEEGNAILTCVVTGNNVREWQWYSRGVDETMELVNIALADEEEFPIEFSGEEDADWEAFAPFEF